MVDLVAAFSANQDVHLRYPHAVRPWQHVLDCLAGYLTLTDALLRGEQAGEAFNFGPGPESFVEVGAVAELVAELWGTEAGVVVDPAPELHEAGLLALDAGRAGRELGWRDRLKFTDAMRWTVDWAKRVYAGEDPRLVCRDQIADFRTGGRE